MGYVVAVNHDGRQIELEFLGELEAIELLDKDRHHLLAEGLDELNHQLAAPHDRRMTIDGLSSCLEPGFARVTAAVRVRTHVGRAAKTSDAVDRNGGAVAVEVDLQRGSDEQVCRVEAGKLRVQPIGTHRAVPPGEVDVGSGAHVGIHAYFRTKAVDLFDPPRLDGGNECRMRVECPVGGNLALESELFAVSRQQQLDGGGVESNAMVQPFDAVFCVNAFDRHHGGQDLRFGDTGRVASEQRFDIERLRRLDHEIHAVAR